MAPAVDIELNPSDHLLRHGLEQAEVGEGGRRRPDPRYASHDRLAHAAQDERGNLAQCSRG